MAVEEDGQRARVAPYGVGEREVFGELFCGQLEGTLVRVRVADGIEGLEGLLVNAAWLKEEVRCGVGLGLAIVKRDANIFDRIGVFDVVGEKEPVLPFDEIAGRYTQVIGVLAVERV